ncbi:Uncharacterised protein [Budvicia aquatica]|uniref:Uncharacterized protein n=1 Tax=Budvicia aquatica TaxID=82979 RepID=A0A484ZC14_9GAMM|nr:Uncharacterised protein [Budvicia aquatica]
MWNKLSSERFQKNDVDRCYEIETVSYEGDEAATKEKIAKRSRVYPQGFIVLENENGVAGFINSGCAHDVVMSDEEFKTVSRSRS